MALVPMSTNPDAQTHELRSTMVALAAGVVEAVQSSKSERTRVAGRRRFELFRAFAVSSSLPYLPATAASVALYAQHLDESGKALATIEAYVSAIASVHKDQRLDNPCAERGVREFLAGKRRQRAGKRKHLALAIADIDMQAVLIAMGKPHAARGGRLETDAQAEARAALDLALILTMTQAGLRRSEAAALLWEDVSIEADGTARINIRRSKTDQTGQGAVVAVKPDCARALIVLWDRRGSDVVFGLSDKQISRRIKAMCAAAGLDANLVSGHTPRVTLARRMSEKGAPTHIIQRQGRWASAGMVSLYTRAANSAETLQWL